MRQELSPKPSVRPSVIFFEPHHEGTFEFVDADGDWELALLLFDELHAVRANPTAMSPTVKRTGNLCFMWDGTFLSVGDAIRAVPVLTPTNQ
jgi:hypothetical protein